MMPCGLVEPKEIQSVVDIVDDDVEVAVVVEISKGGAARGLDDRQGRTEFRGDIAEPSIPQVAINDLRLLVCRLRFQRIDFRVDVAVDQEEIEPAVVIEVEESSTPAEPACVDADAAREGPVFTPSAAGVRVKR